MPGLAPERVATLSGLLREGLVATGPDALLDMESVMWNPLSGQPLRHALLEVAEYLFDHAIACSIKPRTNVLRPGRVCHAVRRLGKGGHTVKSPSLPAFKKNFLLLQPESPTCHVDTMWSRQMSPKCSPTAASELSNLAGVQ
jgi:hypothetical protein